MKFPFIDKEAPKKGGKAAVKKISISLSGHQTSFSLEEEFFTELKKIAARRKKSLAQIIGEIDTVRGPATNLSSAIRVFVLKNK